MRNLLRFASALCVSLLLALPARAQSGGPPPLPEGEGRAILATACSQCHSLATIMAMRDGEPGWRRHVTDMVLRGAQVTATEYPVLVSYLTKNFGPGSPRPTPPVAVSLAAGPGKELVEQRCSQCHDLERVVGIKRQMRDWTSVVTNMVARGAPASAEEARAITAYLVQQYGRE